MVEGGWGPDSASRLVEVRVEDAPKVAERVVEIVNQAGLHARPVMKFVDLANSFEALIWVDNNKDKVDGKSAMEMMLLEAGRGTTLHITASGVDADELVEALAALVADGFDEE